MSDIAPYFAAPESAHCNAFNSAVYAAINTTQCSALEPTDSVTHRTTEYHPNDTSNHIVAIYLFSSHSWSFAYGATNKGTDYIAKLHALCSTNKWTIPYTGISLGGRAGCTPCSVGAVDERRSNFVYF